MPDQFDEINRGRPPSNASTSGATYDSRNFVRGSSQRGQRSAGTRGSGTGANIQIKDFNKHLSVLEDKIKELRNDCHKDLAKYSLIIKDQETIDSVQIQQPDKDVTADQALLSAHVQTCRDIGITPTYRLGYAGYLHLLRNVRTNSSAYLRSMYEMAMRDVGGSNSFDIAILLLIVQSEIENIKSFIDRYIGEVDDTSEYRVLENFQTWIENTGIFVGRLRQAFKKEFTAKLPSADLDAISAKEARESQLVFKIKLNVTNKKLVTDIQSLVREYVKNAEFFYESYLGQALRFRLRVGKTIMTDIKSQVLKAEVENTITTLNAEFYVALSDQLKRNKMFMEKTGQIMDGLMIRDSYANYIKQLSSKGTRLPYKFVEVNMSSEEQDLFGFEKIETFTIDLSPLAEDSFGRGHSALDGLDEDDAHPQYLLKSGGTLTGDITLADGVKIDGIQLATHAHTGEDGSAKISGADIEYSSITDYNVDTSNSSTPVPKNTAVSNQAAVHNTLGQTKVTVEVGFDVESTDNIASYEFEIIKL